MSSYSLFLDESGRFENDAGQAAERVLVLGGILVPGDPSALASRWGNEIQGALNRMGVAEPPHTSQLPEETRAEWRRVATQQGRSAQGRWVFLVGPGNTEDEDVAFARYVRFLGAYVDLCGRIASRLGATTLNVHPAQRTRELGAAAAQRAEQAGLVNRDRGAVLGDRDGHEVVLDRARAMSTAEVRHALDALLREGAGSASAFPGPGEIIVKSANSQDSHYGVWMADLGCNSIYRALRRTPGPETVDQITQSWPEVEPTEVTLVHEHSLPTIRAVDRALREPVPSIAGAASMVARLREQYAGAPAGRPLRSATHGALTLADAFFRETVHRLATLTTRERGAILRTAAAHASADLDAKTGSYEGTWRVLEALWCGQGPCAIANRKDAPQDRELAGHMYRLVVECANHRGDTGSTQSAALEFEHLLRSGVSIALLSEALRVRNLRCVDVQNRLLVSEADWPDVSKDIEHSAHSLTKLADTIPDIGDLAIPEMGVELEPVTSIASDSERSLWTAAGHDAPIVSSHDRERGRCYGTIARSCAFLGQHSAARSFALRARSLFHGDSFDLRFNAAVIARIELDLSRTSGAPSPLVPPAMTLAACDECRDPVAASNQMVSDFGLRFTVDLILRALLWQPQAIAEDRRREWQDAINLGAAGPLFRTIASLRSHPSELIARHAGEIATRAAPRRDWLGLSIALSNEAPEGTIRQMGVFTRMLADVPFARRANAPGNGPVGCATNPSFEYR